MNNKEKINRIASIKPGTFFKLVYETEVPRVASFDGTMRIVKVVETITRTGIRYSSVKKTASSNTSRSNNYIPLIKNKISYNSSTDKNYLNIFPCSTTSAKVHYEYRDKDNNLIFKFNSFDEFPSLKKTIVPSYFKERVTPVMQRISLANIVQI